MPLLSLTHHAQHESILCQYALSAQMPLDTQRLSSAVHTWSCRCCQCPSKGRSEAACLWSDSRPASSRHPDSRRSQGCLCPYIVHSTTALQRHATSQPGEAPHSRRVEVTQATLLDSVRCGNHSAGLLFAEMGQRCAHSFRRNTRAKPNPTLSSCARLGVAC